jgi:hypothetical protein
MQHTAWHPLPDHPCCDHGYGLARHNMQVPELYGHDGDAGCATWHHRSCCPLGYCPRLECDSAACRAAWSCGSSHRLWMQQLLTCFGHMRHTRPAFAALPVHHHIGPCSKLRSTSRACGCARTFVCCPIKVPVGTVAVLNPVAGPCDCAGVGVCSTVRWTGCGHGRGCGHVMAAGFC